LEEQQWLKRQNKLDAIEHRHREERRQEKLAAKVWVKGGKNLLLGSYNFLNNT